MVELGFQNDRTDIENGETGESRRSYSDDDSQDMGESDDDLDEPLIL